MRSARHRALLPFAAVAASTVALSCHRGDSILLVEVSGDVSLMPASLLVTVEPAQAAAKDFTAAPKDGAAITLPTSLTVEMAPNLTGPVTIDVSAVDTGRYVVASGMTTLQDINVGGETIVAVALKPGVLPPTPDGGYGTGGSYGTGGNPGTDGGSGGTGGAAGSLGTGGLSGTGGVAGTGGTKGTGGATSTGGTTGTGGSPATGGVSGTGGTTATGGTTGTGGVGTGGVTGTGGTMGTGGAGGAVDAGGGG